jgi:YVTN family beta-propeller protein
VLVVFAPKAFALPAPGPLRFVAPTPVANALVTSTSVSVRLDAACTFDPDTLAVALDGNAIPAGQFLPFSGCTNDRITSQTVVVSITLPNGSITGGPSSLAAGVAGSFSGTGNGTGLSWNFDGGAEPKTGSPASATFQAGGVFTVRLRATRAQGFSASGLESGSLVTAQSPFQAGDPTPASQNVEVAVPPNVDFVNFESGHVRPLALAPNGNHLYAVNTPDDRLEVFAVGAGTLTRVGDVPVGFEPVAVAARSDTEVWVVNHLSDSVSVVDTTDPTKPRVTATLFVGDEPRDIVFGRADRSRAFVTAAHRGQMRPTDPLLATEGTPRADVWVFDATNLAAAPTLLELFGDTPRALAVTPDGATVFAAAFHSGNQTTTIIQPVVSANGGVPPFPAGSTPGAPATGLIVKFKPASGRWEDERGAAGPNWAAAVPFSLPDRDVFAINANANPPAATGSVVVGVGTAIFNMAVRPGVGGGRLFVGNLESRNHVRFEPLIDATHGVQGHIAESRITVVNGTTPTPVHLNPHVSYAVPTGPPSEVAQSLAFPTDMVFSSNGATLFVAAFGSGKVAAFDAAALQAGTPTRATVDVGGGPSGLALDETRNQLFVMSRFDHTIGIVSNASSPTRALTATVPLGFDPSPKLAKEGRRFLYDAAATSGHGDSACASCHIFGDFDSLAWDLGDPFGAVVSNPNPFLLGGGGATFHPLKGPMTTQSLRGMAGAGPMHWRGDRTGGVDPGGDPLDEDAAFKKFNPAFVGLLGRSAQLSAAEMQQFTDFILTVRYPPNPIRPLDDDGTPSQDSGENFFKNTGTDAGNTCEFCHGLPFGTEGFSTFEGETQEFKVAHMRNLYQKVGMFGVPSGVPGIPATGNLGPQVRGFGYLHDGSISTIFTFVSSPVFNNLNDTLRRDLEAFALALDTGLRPVVGQQLTVTAATKAAAPTTTRVGLFVGQAEAGAGDLVVQGVVGGVAHGWLYDPATNLLRPDSLLASSVAESTLRSGLTGADVLTYTMTPPGTGERTALDRDRDTWLDGSESTLGTDPADPHSNPWAFAP